MNSNLRVRFAPSPTGYLHVGGLRTALYNYLYAKKNNGSFILRIEDTDQKRLVPGALKNLINTLKDCHLDYDEGPDKEKGVGPYIQSKRTSIYKKYVDKLIENEKAYYCFCSPEDLEEMRKKAEEKKEIPKYDGRCKKLSKEEIKKRLDSGDSFVIRLNVPENENISFHDIVRGNIAINTEQVDDQILIKSDGFPTYHLANVIDDHFMKINCVIRGEEWLPSTPKHVLLYQAFGWDIPEFAHLPLLLNSDRSKLSKRQGDVAVEDYLKRGYLSEALINFIALLGWNPGDDREIYSLEELVELFDLNRVNKAGAVFDMDKLKWMNGQYIRSVSDEKLIGCYLPFIKKRYPDVDEEMAGKMILSVKNNFSDADELINETKLFFNETVDIEAEDKKILEKEESKKVIMELIRQIEENDQLNKEIFFKIMKSVGKVTGIKKAALWMPVRIAMTGVSHGPDIGMVVDIFGKEKAINNLKKVL